jgi:peroxiredoxin
MVIRRVAALGGLSAAIVLLASCLSVLVARSTNTSGPLALLDMQAPDFTLKDTEGNAINLRSLRGQVVVLMFTDPRCPVSNEYSGRIMDVVRKYEKQPVRFLAIATGTQVKQSSYLKELCLQRKVLAQNFPTLVDAEGKAARIFGAQVTPSFYVIDRQSVLRYAGAFDDSRDGMKVKKQHVSKAIKIVLEDGAVPVPEIPAVGCPILR